MKDFDHIPIENDQFRSKMTIFLFKIIIYHLKMVNFDKKKHF